MNTGPKDSAEDWVHPFNLELLGRAKLSGSVGGHVRLGWQHIGLAINKEPSSIFAQVSSNLPNCSIRHTFF